MSKKKWIVASIVGALTVGGLSMGLHAHEQGECGFGRHAAMHGDHRGFGGPKPEMVAKHLDMNDEQREAFFAIVEEAKPTLKAGFQSMKAARHTMKTLDPDSETYTTDLHNHADLQSQQVRQQILAMGEMKQKVHAILTDEQKAKVREFQEKMQHHRGWGRGPDES